MSGVARADFPGQLIALDEEEIVTQKALLSLNAFCELGLLGQRLLREANPLVAPLLLHPSPLIRHVVVGYFVGMARNLSSVEVSCFVMPLLRPFLKWDLTSLDARSLAGALKEPVCIVQYSSL